MTQTEIFQNMTKGQWFLSFDDFDDTHSILLKEKGFKVGRCYIAERIQQGYDNGASDAAAILSAVNNTYGKGINPEAVEELKNILIDLL